MRTPMNWFFVVLLILAPVAATADLVVVQPSSEMLADAWYSCDASDTLLLLPGMCWVSFGTANWPLVLSSSNPAIVSLLGATDTIIFGDGSTAAFRVPEEVPDTAELHVEGVTFRSLSEVVDHSYYPMGRIYFVDNIVEACTGNIALDASSCAPTSVVSQNLITGNSGKGLHVYHNSGLVEGNEISYNQVGIQGSCCEHPMIRENHIHHNAQHGIDCGFYCNAEDNTIEDNGGIGISVYGAHDGFSNVEGNVIRRNNVGINLVSLPHHSIVTNDICDNVDYNVTCNTYAYSEIVDLTGNWWGTVDPDEIAASILDCDDDSAIGMCVLFEPCCGAPGCGAVAVREQSWGSIKALYRDGR